MIYRLLALTLVMLALSACTGPVLMGTDAAVIYATRPDQPPPTDPALQIPPHESWCYKTMGDIECYDKPQDVVPSRLVNVDPPHQYPVDVPSYQERVHPPLARVSDEPPVVISRASDAPVLVQAQNLPEVKPPEAALTPQAAATKPMKHKRKKRHKKVVATPAPAVAEPPAVLPPVMP